MGQKEKKKILSISKKGIRPKIVSFKLKESISEGGLRDKRDGVVLVSRKRLSKTFVLSLQGLEYEELTKPEVEKLIKTSSKKTLSDEAEIKIWISKFLSNEWYELELKRIELFKELSSDIEGFEEDIEIESSYTSMALDGEEIEYIKKSPDVNKSKIQDSIQRIVPIYANKLKNLLENAKKKYSQFKIPNSKKILKVISNFDAYWDYLDYFRTAYSDIYDLISPFDYSITVKLLLRTIMLEVYYIDREYFFRNDIARLKKKQKLIQGEI